MRWLPCARPRRRGSHRRVRNVRDVSSVRVLAMLAAAALETFALAGCDTARQALSADEADEAARMRGGYTATGTEISATDANGASRYQLRAAAIEQKAGEEMVALTDVTVEFPDSRGQSWRLTSRTGRMSTGERNQPAIIDLEGDVKLASAARGRLGLLALETSALRFDTARNRATTDRPVKLKSGERTLEARGLTADLATRQLRLESEVHGHFTP